MKLTSYRETELYDCWRQKQVTTGWTGVGNGLCLSMKKKDFLTHSHHTAGLHSGAVCAAAGRASIKSTTQGCQLSRSRGANQVAQCPFLICSTNVAQEQHGNEIKHYQLSTAAKSSPIGAFCPIWQLWYYLDTLDLFWYWPILYRRLYNLATDRSASISNARKTQQSVMMMMMMMTMMASLVNWYMYSEYCSNVTGCQKIHMPIELATFYRKKWELIKRKSTQSTC